MPTDATTRVSYALIWLVVAGLLGARHEAEIAHVVDHHTGLVVHAPALSGHHGIGESDIHGQADPRGDHDACALVAALHQAVRAVFVQPLALAVSRVAVLVAPRTPAFVVVDIYLLAPKTSPPLA